MQDDQSFLSLLYLELPNTQLLKQRSTETSLLVPKKVLNMHIAASSESLRSWNDFIDEENIYVQTVIGHHPYVRVKTPALLSKIICAYAGKTCKKNIPDNKSQGHYV